eukprot:TRINITY_DN5220_c0_g1_i1.p1 TRINITY_DN5220_c0_g1~~TRINITY_DN5220_c0_g1_i1.p1  ORF type:complete len:686 (+),score=214.24 TRINITY_DN5220_c0_g1_i1:133-2190(+)
MKTGVLSMAPFLCCRSSLSSFRWLSSMPLPSPPFMHASSSHASSVIRHHLVPHHSPICAGLSHEQLRPSLTASEIFIRPHRRPSFLGIRTSASSNSASDSDTMSTITVAPPSVSLDSENGGARSAVGLTRPSLPVLPQISIISTAKSFPVTEAPPSDVFLLLVPDSAFARDEEMKKFTGFAEEALVAADESLGGILLELVQEEDNFAGKPGQIVSARVSGFSSLKRVGVLAVGKLPDGRSSASDREKFLSAWKSVGAAVATSAKAAGAKKVVLQAVGVQALQEQEKVSALEALTSGLLIGLFEDTRFKSDPKVVEKLRKLQEVEVEGLGEGEAYEAAVFKSVRVSTAVMLTKQLVNAPPNVLTPGSMAEVAVEIAAAHADVMSATILDEDECRKRGMGAYLGVAAASENPPKFIHLQYSPPGGNIIKRIAIVGKGLTFDSGGYNLKVGGSMIELMKFDMGGAAATLGAAKAIGSLQPPGVQVNFIIAACENMVSGKGMRPGDILTASNGKTIEVNNTDAEGRLTLADALLYAQELKVDAIVDLATLTGACIVALGTDIAGLFTPKDEVAEEISLAAKAAGEKLWRMPMEEGYWEGMKSNIADMVNTGGRWGGAITASLFLKQFVDDKVDWAHLDIAGPVWNQNKGGGTGFATALLVEWVLAKSAAAAVAATEPPPTPVPSPAATS